METEIKPLSEQQIKNFVEPGEKYFVMGVVDVSKICHVVITKLSNEMFERCKIFISISPECMGKTADQLNPAERLMTNRADKLLEDMYSLTHIKGTVTNASIIEPTLKAAGSGETAALILSSNDL